MECRWAQIQLFPLVQIHLCPLPITAHCNLPSRHCIPAKTQRKGIKKKTAPIEHPIDQRTFITSRYYYLSHSNLTHTRSGELETKIIACESGFSNCNCFITLKGSLVVLWEEHTDVLNRALQHRVSLSERIPHSHFRKQIALEYLKFL